MTENFARAIDIVLAMEGGYVNDPKDPGGETKFGISKRAYPDVDIAALTEQQAMDIYERDFWQAAKCDVLPWPLCLFVFDAAVNQGVGTAIKLLQRAAGIAQDGLFGPNTQKAVAAQKPTELGPKYLAERALYYVGVRNFDRYGRGWLRRLFYVSMEG